MWHKEKNRNPIVSLALLLALASTPMMTSLFKSDYALAQSPTETPSFPLPTVVPNDAKIRIDGSASMTRANEALKERFEKKYSGTNVELATNGTKEALKALQDGKIDIAAIGRGLTPEEEQLGLKQQRLRREKIAIIVGKDNPYKGDLKNDKFTQIYRGEITNWSQLGGPNKKIRVIDRPDSSDTREAFRNYPLFAGNLDTGSTATKLDSDDPAQVVKELGDDGIGFVLANQVSKLDNVRILSMHKTLPDDPRYPYSQPLVYVFKENPSEAVKSFVGYATAKPGQEAIETAREAEAAAVAATVARAVGEGPEGEDAAATATATPATTEAATADEKAAGTETEKAATADGEAAGTGNKTATDGNNTDGVGAATNTSATDNPGALIQPGNSAGVAAEAGEGTIPWWWILLPVAVLGALAFWWLLGRRKSQEEDTVARGVLPKDSPPPFTPTSTTGPVKEPVANTPVEPSAGINTAPLETPPNTTPGINAAGIAAGAAGLGLGAAALAGKDKDSTSENDDTPLNENSPELPLDEPNPGINTAQVETPPNTTPGINTAGIAAGIAGLGLGAAALAGRDKDNTSENSPELRLNAPDVELPNVSGRDLNVDVPDVELPSVSGKGLDVDAPDLQQPDISSTGLDDVETPDWQQPDIPDTTLDLEAPAAVVNNSHHSLPRISTPIEAETPPATEHEVSDSQPEENNPSTQEELPSASTNNWLGNFAAGAGAVAAAGAGAAALGAEKIKSKLAGKDASKSTEDEQVDSESLEINGTVPYPQLPDVWDADKEEANNREESSLYEGDALNPNNTDLEQPPQTSPTDLWGTSQTEEVTNQEQQQTSYLEQLPQTSPTDLWGTSQTEEVTNQEQQQTSYLEQPPQTSPTDLWGTSQTESATNQEQQQTQPTEQPNNQEEEEEEEKSSFSLGGIAAGAAAGLAG
ncbi:MAG: substrate-binding domain-containing protein, partial [Cyanobacteria bacterium J06633_8]